MRSNHYRLTIRLFILTLIFAPATLAFSSSPPSLRESSSAHRVIQNSKWPLASTSNDHDEKAKDEVQPKAEYGVSYIGGDPCGSKYNDDPFDVQVQKPGMPDDMKARIQALVDKKVAEEKAAAEATTKSD